MPSKLLIAAGEMAHAARTASIFGVHLPEPEIDGPGVMKRLQSMRDHFVKATKSSIADIPDGICVKARARFLSSGELLLDDGRTVSMRSAIIATGAAPVIPGPFKVVEDRIITNETLFDRDDLPQSVGVIGAGPLGLELAQALSRLGVRIEVFDKSETLVGMPEGDQEASLREALTKEFPIHLGVKPRPERTPDGVRLRWTGKSNGEAEFSHVLVSAGRAPQLEGLALEAAGLKTDDHGTPLYDEQTMQCGDAPIFITGDANHDLPVLHEAAAEGTIAGKNAANWPDLDSFQRKVRLQIMFTEPNFARIGEMAESGNAHVTGRVDYTDQGRAKAMARNQGICEVYACSKTGKLVGATLVGPAVEHLAHLLAWSVQCGASANELLDNPFYHPTLEEGLKTALEDICKSLNLDKPESFDEGALPGDR